MKYERIVRKLAVVGLVLLFGACKAEPPRGVRLIIDGKEFEVSVECSRHVVDPGDEDGNEQVLFAKIHGVLVENLVSSYVGEHSLQPSAEEVDELISFIFPEGMKTVPEGTPEWFSTGYTKIYESQLLQWKLNQHLYELFGGRIAVTGSGPFPCDAYLRYFRDCEQTGRLKIYNTAIADRFWAFMEDDCTRLCSNETGSAEAFSNPSDFFRRGISTRAGSAPAFLQQGSERGQ